MEDHSPPPSKKRAYTFICVFYGTHNELIEFLKHTKHSFYVLHDKDEADAHFHIYCTFRQNKSFASVRSLMCSKANILVKIPEKTALENRDYFARNPPEQYPDKFHYGLDAIVYDDTHYWNTVFKDDSVPNEKNAEFLDELLNPSMRIEDMAIKYGKDFMKNCEKYIQFRYFVFRERAVSIHRDISEITDKNLYKKAFIDL